MDFGKLKSTLNNYYLLLYKTTDGFDIDIHALLSPLNISRINALSEFFGTTDIDISSHIDDSYPCCQSSSPILRISVRGATLNIPDGADFSCR